MPSARTQDDSKLARALDVLASTLAHTRVYILHHEPHELDKGIKASRFRSAQS